MTTYYVNCGDIRERVQAENTQAAAVLAFRTHHERTLVTGQPFHLGGFVSVSQTGFDDDDALWRLASPVIAAAGITLEPVEGKIT